MKKSITSILLVMVIILTMTACVKTPDTQATTSKTSNATAEVATTETESAIIGLIGDEVEHECNVEFFDRHHYGRNAYTSEMSLEEIAEYLEQMENDSATTRMYRSCIYALGRNISYIWENDNCISNREEFETQTIAIFNNVMKQAKEQNIPMDRIDSWNEVPVAEVLCKYYSSQHFEFPMSPYFSIPCESLTEEEVLRVAKVFFENPVFATNSTFATYLLCDYPNGEAAELAWKHLVSVSNGTAADFSQENTTYYTCLAIFRRYPELLGNTDTVIEIAKNILQNPHYNFVEKYVYLCSDFCSEPDFEATETEIRNIAYDFLYELAQNANKEDYELITQVLVKLYDKYEINSRALDKLQKSYDVELLKKCLVSWKEVANTRLPSWY